MLRLYRCISFCLELNTAGVILCIYPYETKCNAGKIRFLFFAFLTRFLTAFGMTDCFTVFVFCYLDVFIFVYFLKNIMQICVTHFCVISPHSVSLHTGLFILSSISASLNASPSGLELYKHNGYCNFQT